MTPAERTKYFRDMWPAACAAKGWTRSDDERRRAVALECMRLVRGPAVTTSDPQFRRDEVTALFCYLDHLAHPADLERAARWVDCQTDYRAYNRARQADYHERALYGRKGSTKLQRDRFAGRRNAQGEPLDKFDPEEIRKRHLTMASRHQRAEREGRAAVRNMATPDISLPAAEELEAEAVTTPDPEYVPAEDQPF